MYASWSCASWSSQQNPTAGGDVGKAERRRKPSAEAGEKLLIPVVCPDCTWDSALSISVTSLGNIGPGAAQIGPAFHFDWLNPAAKLLSAFEMLIGRLELFTILVLFLPSFWHK